ncbi:MAG: Lrp/AsnC ligand binding domain-containing protein [Steroidobacteraceae bacterium]
MLDEIDRRILRVLQKNGRVTNQDLANSVHLSPAACLQRHRRLKKLGYVVGYSATVDPIKTGWSLLVFIEVLLDRTNGDVFKDFAGAVNTIPEIQECHMVAGGFDYLIKARMRDMGAYRKFLGETIMAIKGVRETRTYAVIEEIKATLTLPI